jgi:hypothetical protein
MTDVRILNQFQLRRDWRNIIALPPFGPPPGSEQSLQIGEAAGVGRAA